MPQRGRIIALMLALPGLVPAYWLLSESVLPLLWDGFLVELFRLLSEGVVRLKYWDWYFVLNPSPAFLALPIAA